MQACSSGNHTARSQPARRQRIVNPQRSATTARYGSGEVTAGRTSVAQEKQLRVRSVQVSAKGREKRLPVAVPGKSGLADVLYKVVGSHRDLHNGEDFLRRFGEVSDGVAAVRGAPSDGLGRDTRNRQSCFIRDADDIVVVFQPECGALAIPAHEDGSARELHGRCFSDRDVRHAPQSVTGSTVSPSELFKSAPHLNGDAVAAQVSIAS